MTIFCEDELKNKAALIWGIILDILGWAELMFGALPLFMYGEVLLGIICVCVAAIFYIVGAWLGKVFYWKVTGKVVFGPYTFEILTPDKKPHFFINGDEVFFTTYKSKKAPTASLLRSKYPKCKVVHIYKLPDGKLIQILLDKSNRYGMVTILYDEVEIVRDNIIKHSEIDRLFPSPEVEEEATYICGNCKATIKELTKFCPHCAAPSTEFYKKMGS